MCDLNAQKSNQRCSHPTQSLGSQDGLFVEKIMAGLGRRCDAMQCPRCALQIADVRIRLLRSFTLPCNALAHLSA